MSTKITPTKIYHLDREIHMMSQYVAVVWPTTEVGKTLVQDGITYHGRVRSRYGEPYIDFVAMKLFDQGGPKEELVEDEDSPAMGGLNIETAEDMIKGLTNAIAYLKQETA